jgi:hypothetical protein
VADIVLDNTILYDAADALDREADVLHAIAIDDADVVGCIREAAQQLREVARCAEKGTPHGELGWPAIRIVVQGVAEASEKRCQALRGPEAYQPVCTLPAGHDGPHRWGRTSTEREFRS